MNLHRTIKYSAIYAGLAFALVTPLSYLYAVLASTLHGFELNYLTSINIAESLMNTAIWGLGGVFAGGVFGLIYDSILGVLVSIFKLNYRTICKSLTYAAYYILGLSMAFIVFVHLAWMKGSDGFVIFIPLLIGYFCWTPLIPFIFLNRKLLAQDSTIKKKR